MIMWNEYIQKTEMTDKVTEETVKFAKRFGTYLGKDENSPVKNKLTTNQLRKFFGEIKRQQLRGYDKSEFVLLKPKLAYAVGRDTNKTKIDDFYRVISSAMDYVTDERQFNNFVSIFEAIVAYHKAVESGKDI